MVVLDDVVEGVELSAHVDDLRVSDQPGDRVDGMDVSVQEARGSVVEDHPGLADSAPEDGVAHHVVAVVETS